MVNGLIMLEGNKGTFKSTLANRLADVYECEIVKGIPKGDLSLLKSYKTEKDAQDFLCSFWNSILIEAKTKLLIVDRTYVTPMVFKNAFNDTNRRFVYLDETKFLELERAVMCLPYAFIFLHDTSQSIWERYTHRGTHAIAKTDFIRNIDEIELLNKKYLHFFSKETILEYYDVDCQKIDPNAPQEIIDYINTRF